MNKKIILFALSFAAVAQLWAQSDDKSRIPLLGEEAPVFTAQSTNGTIKFPNDFGRKWKVLFSHPADFTPVCTSELMSLALLQKDFNDLNVSLVVISTDSLYIHSLWVKSMEEMMSKNNNPVKINFPLVDDSRHTVGWKYGMFTASNESFKAQRGVFIVDPQNKIRAVTFYPINVGRNMDEIKRTVIALQTADNNTVLMPANWKPGDDVLLPYPNSADHYSSNYVQEPGSYDLSWYMLFKKLDK